MPTPELVGSVRAAIYPAIVRTASAPVYGDVARELGIHSSIVQQAYRALADAHVIVLSPGTMDIWSAPPFSAVSTPFRVRSGGMSWYAPCAWDAFGIPAALKRDTTCDAACARSGEPLHTGVRDGEVIGDGVIHLLVPAARFWDDIVHT